MSEFDAYEHLGVSLNPDGTLTRHNKMPRTPANPNPVHGELVKSKDVTINEQKKTWARIYCPTRLPENDGKVGRLPIQLYFHSGGWIDHGVQDLFYDDRCSYFAGEIPALLVSVEYRLAPEHRLPAQYDDAVDAMMWIREQMVDPGGDRWIKDYGDFSKCCLGGRGNGANIAYHACVRSLDLDLEPMKVTGIILNQPMFSGNQRTRSELKYACDELFPLPVWDLMWELALPEGADRDHVYCNPMTEPPDPNKVSKLRCLLIGYSMDGMIDRQQEFVSMMINCGVRIEAHFDFGFHGVDLIDYYRRGSYNVQLIKEFLNK